MALRNIAVIASSTGIVSNGGTVLSSMFVSSNPNNNTIKLWNGTIAAGQVILDTFIPYTSVGFYNLGNVSASGGVFCTMGNSVAVTISFHLKDSD